MGLFYWFWGGTRLSLSENCTYFLTFDETSHRDNCRFRYEKWLTAWGTCNRKTQNFNLSICTIFRLDHVNINAKGHWHFFWLFFLCSLRPLLARPGGIRPYSDTKLLTTQTQIKLGSSGALLPYAISPIFCKAIPIWDAGRKTVSYCGLDFWQKKTRPASPLKLFFRLVEMELDAEDEEESSNNVDAIAESTNPHLIWTVF